MTTLEVHRYDRLAFSGEALLQADGSSVTLADVRLIVQGVHGDVVLVSATSEQPVGRYILALRDVVAALTPNPIIPCDRCARHGALFTVEGKYICGTGNQDGPDKRACHMRASIFALPLDKQGRRLQAYVDDLLREQGYPLDGFEPRVWEGDYA